MTQWWIGAFVVMLAAALGYYIRLIIGRYEKKEDIPYNRIIVQKPDGTIPVRKGRIITVVVSDGPRPVMIPSMVGQPLRLAETTLQEQKIRLKKIIFVPGTEQAEVLAQVPAAGENILDDEGMVLVVSGREKKYYVMPDMTKDYGATLEEMDKMHLNYVLTADKTSGTTQGVRTNVPPRTIFNEETVLEIKIPGGG